MIKTIVILLSLCWGLSAFTQEPAVPAKETILTVVEEYAEFPGGHAAFRKFLADSIHYPEKCTEGVCDVKVFVRFVVTAEGKIMLPEIMRHATDCPEWDEEVLRIVRLMPDWIPAKMKGVPVNSYFILPVKFHCQ